MRLISQNGTRDCPYETSYLRIKYEEYCLKGEYPKIHKVFSIYANDSNMGEYSTKEKALKVMKDIREDWKDDLAFFCFPADEEVET